MSLNEYQFKFAKMVPLLILYAYEKGYTISYGDTWAREGHKINSLHYKRLAIDLNLFKDGKYLTKTSDHKFLGIFWEQLHINNRWGGRYNDGNHYELVPYDWRTK